MTGRSGGNAADSAAGCKPPLSSSPLYVGAHSDAPHPRDRPEPVAERTSTLAAERQTLTYIAPARQEAAEETPEELTVEPEPENRYAELHFSDEDVYILLAPRLPRGARRELRGTSRRRRGRSKPYALRLFPGYGRGGRISEIRRRMAILPACTSTRRSRTRNNISRCIPP